jgi:hypothetical protein
VLVSANAKFAAMVLTQCAGAEEIEDDIEVAKGVRAAQRLNFQFPTYFREWLGTRMFDEMHEDGLVVYVTAPAQQPEVLDAENHALIQGINDIFYGLTLHGVPAFSRSFVITGANIGGELRIRQHNTLTHIERTFGTSFPVRLAELRRAIPLADRLRSIQAPGDGPWGRLLRATRTLLEANGESNANGDRLHQFVRSIDALIKAEPGRNRTLFGHRVQTFVRRSANASEVLLELYDLRGLVKHLNVPTDLFHSGTHAKRRERVNRRTRQADALARFAMRRIFEASPVFEMFRTDAEIDQFWALRDDERIRLWGDQLDLLSIP